MSQFESVISADPKVRSVVLAKALSPKGETGGEAADRAAGNDQAADEPESDASDGDDGSSADDSSSADDGGDADDSDASGSRSAGTDLVDTLINDMSAMNDLVLKDVNPKYGFSRGPGYVLAGVDSGGSNYLLPWFVHFEGEGNSATNTRIQMRNLRVFVKKHSSGSWERLIDADSYEGIQCDQGSNYFHCPQIAHVREESDGASSLPLPDLNMHGWWDSRARIDGDDIAAIVVSLEARLILDDDSREDDRNEARYLLHVGADYYPSDAPPEEILPAVGLSRAKRITNDWQTFAMTTLSDVGLQEPGGGITADELRADPPPLD